jgi:hypothetical protein
MSGSSDYYLTGTRSANRKIFTFSAWVKRASTGTHFLVSADSA